jgi:hypothetical protein
MMSSSLLTGLQHPPTDEGASKGQERLMNVCAPLVAHLEPSMAVEPRECPLDHPARAPQPLTRLDATPSNPRDNAPPAQCSTAAGIIIPLIGMEFHWAMAWASSSLSRQSERRNRIDGDL